LARIIAKRKGKVKVMGKLVFYNCLDCGTLFLGEYGVEPVCPRPRCVQRRYEEIIANVLREKEILARLIQFAYERRVVNNMWYSCPHCNTLFHVGYGGRFDCPTCKYNCREPKYKGNGKNQKKTKPDSRSRISYKLPGYYRDGVDYPSDGVGW
jgi:hypothetical protein